MTDFKSEYKKALENKQPDDKSLNELLLKMQKQAEDTKKAKKSPLKIVLPLTSIAAAAACACLAITSIITLSSSGNKLANSASGNAPSTTSNEMIQDEEPEIFEDGALPEQEADQAPSNDMNYAEDMPSNAEPSVDNEVFDTVQATTQAAVVTTTPANKPAGDSLSEETIVHYSSTAIELYPDADLISITDANANELHLDDNAIEIGKMLLEGKIIGQSTDVSENVAFTFSFKASGSGFEIIVPVSFNNAYLCSDDSVSILLLSDEALSLIKKL